MKKAHKKVNKGCMRRTSRIYLTELNNNKYNLLRDCIINYVNAVNYITVVIWSDNNKDNRFTSSLLDKNMTDKIRERFNISARLSQCVGKQSKEMINSQHKLNKNTMPRLTNKIMQLDSRFSEINEFNGHFEMCVKLKSGLPKIIIPFNKTKHFNKFYNDNWQLSKSIRIGYDEKGMFIDFIFEKERPKLKEEGNILGIDRGYLSPLCCSDKQEIGKDFNKIILKVKNNIPKVKHKKYNKHHKNYKNYGIINNKNNKYNKVNNNDNNIKQNKSKRVKNVNIVNARTKAYHYIETELYRYLKQLDLSQTKTIVLEDLKYVKHGKRGKFSRHVNGLLSFWYYTKCHNFLERYCEENGIAIVYKHPSYTSQHCSNCGNIDKTNRKGKDFKCSQCNFIADADYNASKNLELLQLAGCYSICSLKNKFNGNFTIFL